MKAYPIIYSRTKYVDYVPDFLVRPSDLNFKIALEYVNNSLNDLDTINCARYSVFSDGNYAIIGVSCLSKDLEKKLSENESEYVRDEKKRPIACFIGLAFPADKTYDDIPTIELKGFWEIYMKYIPRQWNYPTDTHSEKISTNDFVDIPSQRYVHSQIKLENLVNGIKNIKENELGAAYHFIYKVLNKENDSYISQVNTTELFNKLCFTNAGISDAVIFKIKNQSLIPVTTQNNSKGAKAALWESYTDSDKNEDTTSIENQYEKGASSHKHKDSFLKAAIVVGGLLTASVIITIIISLLQK